MRTRVALALLAAGLVLGGAIGLAVALPGGAGPMPRLPGPYEFEKKPRSPGTVTFNHDSHVSEKEPDCTGCHPRLFRMLERGLAADGSRVTHRVMDRGGQCGSCHDGKTAFGMKECSTCHGSEKATPERDAPARGPTGR